MADPISMLTALVKAGTDIAAATDVQKRNAQLIEFQKVVIDLLARVASIQAENATLASAKRDLEQEIVRMKDWDAEKKRYALTAPWQGAVAYALKESMARGEQPHWLCANCYDGGKKSFLNPKRNAKSAVGLACGTCRAEVACEWFGGLPQPGYVPG